MSYSENIILLTESGNMILKQIADNQYFNTLGIGFIVGLMLVFIVVSVIRL